VPDAEPGYPLSREPDLDALTGPVEALGSRFLSVAADVRSERDVAIAIDRAIDEFGRIDILVANAGIIMLGQTWELSRAEWNLLFDTNVTGAWECCRRVIPQMIENGEGRIILTSSTAALRGFDKVTPYSTTKAAIIGLGRSLAVELGPAHITVNVVCPGTVPSGANRGLAAAHDLDWDELLAGWRRSQALDVALEAEDVASAVVFLCSDAARYITGVVLPVDAGVSAG
jgi:(+)-trans-carveol dehydrogenase